MANHANLKIILRKYVGKPCWFYLVYLLFTTSTPVMRFTLVLHVPNGDNGPSVDNTCTSMQVDT